jgi:quinol monooxygenase YgiN
VIVRYEIADGDRDAFLATMHAVEQSRRRTGARSWNVYDDRERPGFLIEAFEVGSWREHLSQHHTRTTGYDTEIVDAARALSKSPPTVEHLIAAPVTRRAAPSTAATPPKKNTSS